jgi:citrate lyase subunit beta/citryl-CoA lyase
MTIRPRRSALYMPASNPRAIAKARSLDCDVVILDLEDAVAPEKKAEARDAACAAVREGGFGRRELVVRVNAPGTEWADDDLAALVQVRPDAVLLPKVSAPETLVEVHARLPGVPLWAMIETPRAILDLAAIVGAAEATGLELLVAGTNDLAKDLRCRPGESRAPLLPILTSMVVAARASGLAVLDGVCNAIEDEARLVAECEQGLAWGFDGKTVIHPAQIAAANRVFTPSEAEIAWARTVVGAFGQPEHQGRGAIRIEGKMVERLHLAEAERTLAIAEICGVEE